MAKPGLVVTMRTAPQPTEAQFQAQIVDLAELCGWRSNHVFRSASNRDGGGWRTATTCIGWPDLALWKPGRFLVVEVKAERGRLTPEQRDVLASLRAAGIDARCWKPSDWPEVEQTLRGRPRSPATVRSPGMKAPATATSSTTSLRRAG